MGKAIHDIGNTVNNTVFKKIKNKKAVQSNTIEYGSGTGLRKLNQLLKLAEDLNLDTFIYNPNKEFLVNVVNERNSIIIQKLKENIETVRLICRMDRHYRSRIFQRKKSKNLLVLDKHFPIDMSMYEQQCTDIEGGEDALTLSTLNELNDSNNPSCMQLEQLSLELNQNNSNLVTINTVDLNNILATSNEYLGSETPLIPEAHSSNSEIFVYRVNDFSECDSITEGLPPVVRNDVTLNDTIDTTIVEVNYSNFVNNNVSDNKEFSKIVISTPSNYTGAELFTYASIPNIQVEPVSTQDCFHEINNNYGL